MGGVIALGECMVELSLQGPAATPVGAGVSYAGDTYNTAVYLRRLGLDVAYGTAVGKGDPFSAGILATLADEGIGRGLMVEAQGRLYAGTDGHGLYRLSEDGRTFAPVPVSLPSRRITALLPAPGALYVGTDEGVARLPLGTADMETR